ncbi:MAG: hypothetical protein LQ337_005170 [Flavoplaca oasis]|nr:MAG: hypothetical protein LQ337_005170 [Flavoplaca oasis]
MDMRNLHTSLPRSTTAQQPPEQLLQAFKTAALSVTNLYKTAALDQARARQNGYQEALDEILAFLDKEHLGLGDGEGWKVRQWATERLDGSAADRTAISESDDERAETEKRARSSSPAVPHKPVDVLRPQDAKSPIRNTSAPPVPQEIPQPPNSHPKSPPEVFSFRSAHTYPQDVDMVSLDSTTGTSTAGATPQPEIQSVPSVPQLSPTLRVGVLPRAAKTPHRTTNSHINRHNTRGSTLTNRRPLGTGAGSKRKFDLNEYFDVGSLGEGREGFAGKKGRLN